MNFSEALKGPLTRSGKLRAIHSAGQTELGRKITDTEITSLSKNFTLDDTYNNLQKVKQFSYEII